MEKRLGLRNPQMSLLRDGSELWLRDRELAPRSCSDRLRKQVHVQNGTRNNARVHSALCTVNQLLCLVFFLGGGGLPCKIINICQKFKDWS